MKKIYASIKLHIRDNATYTVKHLKNNSGDGYTWFLFMTVAFLMIFGALFTIMSTAVDMREIRKDVDEAANDVFVEVREVAYDKITDGATNYSFTELSNTDVMKKMATHLNANYEGDGLYPYIYKTDARGNMAYKIEDFSFVYIPQINSLDGGITYKVGDVDKDGEVNDTDVQLIEEYINGVKPGADLPIERVDINEDGTVNNKDVILAEGLVEYFEAHPHASKESASDKKSAILMINFSLTVDISYGTMSFGDNTDSYHYYSTMSFKAAR